MQSSCSSCPMGVALSLKPWLWDDSFKGLTPSRSAFLSFSLPFPFLSFFSLFYLFLSFITLPTRSVLDGNQHCRHYAGSASLASPCLQGRWNPQQNAHKTMVCTIQLGVPWPRFGLQPNWNIIKYNGICNQSLSPSLSLYIYTHTHIYKHCKIYNNHFPFGNDSCCFWERFCVATRTTLWDKSRLNLAHTLLLHLDIWEG